METKLNLVRVKTVQTRITLSKMVILFIVHNIKTNY